MHPPPPAFLPQLLHLRTFPKLPRDYDLATASADGVGGLEVRLPALLCCFLFDLFLPRCLVCCFPFCFPAWLRHRPRMTFCGD